MTSHQAPITNTSRPRPQHLPRLLMLTHSTPFPLDRGDRIRCYQILKYLAPHYDISLASISDQPITAKQHASLSPLTMQLKVQPKSPTIAKLHAAHALLTGKPLTLACFQHKKLAKTIAKWHEDNPFDCILTCCSTMLPYARIITKTNPHIRHIFDLINVDSQKWQQHANETLSPMRLIYQLEANRLRPLEAGKLDRFDTLTIASGQEAEVYKRSVTKPTNFKLHTVPNGVDVEYYTPAPDPDNHNIVFTGDLNYRPNLDAVTWFANNVLPYLANYIPDVTLNIIGEQRNEAIQSLASRPNIKLAGPAIDIRPHLANASAVIAPLLIAKGLQNKVLQAMASQRAVICSPLAAQDIDAQHDKHFLIADHPDQWVDQLVRVLNFPAWRKNLATNARKHVEEYCTWNRCLNQLLQLLNPQHQPNSQHQIAA